MVCWFCTTATSELETKTTFFAFTRYLQPSESPFRHAVDGDLLPRNPNIMLYSKGVFPFAHTINSNFYAFLALASTYSSRVY